MKPKRHHNNTGYRQVRHGKTYRQVREIARRLGLKFGKREDRNVE